MTPEGKLQAKFKAAVKKAGGKSYKFVSPAYRGVSDQLVMVPGGTVVFVEIKNGNQDLSPLQEIFRKECLAMNQRHEVIRFEADIPKFIDKYFWHLM